MITIFHPNNTVALTLESFNEGSKLTKKLMSDDYVVLPFELDEPVAFGIGDYVDISLPDEDTILGRYVLTESYTPQWNANTATYRYELRLEAWFMRCKNKKVKYNPAYGGNELSFNLTSSIMTHMGIIRDNLRTQGIKHWSDNSDYIVSPDETVDLSASKLVSYDNISILDALTSICKAFECEWWLTDNVIHLGKCQAGDNVIPADFELGENVSEMSTSKVNDEQATRFYAFGSDRNLPSGYKPNTDPDLTVSAVVQKRLMLPTLSELSPENAALLQQYGLTLSNNGYVERSGILPEQVVEAVFVDDKVYPRTDCWVKKYTTYTDTVENEDGTTTTRTYYRLVDGSDFAFDTDMILPGQTLHILFQSGMMNGMDFECQYNDTEKYYEVVANENYGRFLPDTVLHPNKDDKFVLYNWDSTKVAETGLIATASNELLAHLIDYIAKGKSDPNEYNCTEDCFEDTLVLRELGDKVRLINPAYFSEGKVARVIGMEICLDLPYDHPKYTVSENSYYVYQGHVEGGGMEQLTFNGMSYVGKTVGGVGVYLIKTNDATRPNDSNTFSALRIMQDFLYKTKDDIAQGIIGFTKGLWVKAKGLFGIDEKGDARLNNATLQGDVVSDNFQSGWEGSGYALIKDADGVSRLEVDELMIRRKLMAREVEIQRETYIGGLISVGDADGTIYKMTPFDSDGERMNVTVYVIGGVAIGVEADTNKIIALDNTAGTAAFYRCYFVRSDDETKVKNRWKVGDMARCDEWDLVKRNGEGDDANPIGNRFYWRLVINTGTEMLMDADGVEREYIFIDLAAGYSEQLYSWPAVNGDCYVTQTSTPPSPISPQPPIYGYPVMVWPSAVNSDIPAVGDHVVQNGYVNDGRPNRQSIIKMGYNGGTDKTKEFNIFEQIGKDKTSAATQYRYPNNPIKLGSEKTSITADEIFLKTSGGVSPVERYGGEWLNDGTQTANEGELWTYNGQLWRCNTDGTTATPSGTLSAWSLYVQKGEKGDKGDKGDKGADGTSFVPKGTAVGVFDDPDGGQAFEDYVDHYGSQLANGVWLILDRAEAYMVLDGSATQITGITDSDCYIVQVDESEPYGTLTNIVGHAFYHQSGEWKDVGKMTGKDGKDGTNGADGADGLSFEIVPSALVLTETFAGWQMNNGEYVLDQNGNKIPTYSYDLPQTVRVRALYGGLYDSGEHVHFHSIVQSVTNGLNITAQHPSQVDNEFDVVISAGDAINGDWTLDVISISVDPPVGSVTVIHIPVQVNRAGKAYVALDRGVAALGVELEDKIDNAVTVTGKGITVGTMMEDLLKAGLDYEIDKSASASDETLWKYILKFLGDRFEFRDPTDIQSGEAQLRMFISRGLLNVVNPLTGNTQIEFGLDSNNNAVLKYYDAQGNYLYNLGPDGLQMLGSQALGMRTRRMGWQSYENIVANGYRDNPHIILECVAWACADDLQTIVKASCYEMQFKEAAGVYVLVSAHQAQQVEITDYDHNTTYQETITPERDITKENGELYDHKWLDSNISTPQQVIDVMGSSSVIGIQDHLLRSEGGESFRKVFVDDSFDVYHGEGIPSDYIPPSQDATMIIYCKYGVERNYTEVNFSQTVYVRRLRYFREGLEVAYLDIYFNL